MPPDRGGGGHASRPVSDCLTRLPAQNFLICLNRKSPVPVLAEPRAQAVLRGEARESNVKAARYTYKAGLSRRGAFNL